MACEAHDEQVELQVGTDEKMYVDLEFRPIEVDGQLTSVMLLATDETETVRLAIEKQQQEEAHQKAIRTILENVTFGFLIVGPDQKVKEGYTRHCEELFGSTEIVGKTMCDLFGMDDNACAAFEIGLDEVFDDVMPEEVTVAQLQSRFVLGARILHMDGRVIRDEQGKVEGVLMTLSDSTALENAQQQNQMNQSLVTILRQKAAFEAFIDDTRSQLATAEAAITNSDGRAVRMVAHTIKGNVASFGVRHIAKLIHEIEDKPVITQADLDNIQDAFRSFLDEHGEVLGVNFDACTLDEFRITEAHIHRLDVLLKDLEDSDTDALKRWVAEIQRVPVRTFLGPLPNMVSSLAARLGKRVNFKIEGDGTLVDSATVRPVCRNLPHMLRNALDHGIEAPGERHDKSEVAKIALSFDEEPSRYHVTVSDDGRGIDVNALTRRAVELNILTEDDLETMDKKEKLELIFATSLSTKSEANDISGRGMGMPAIKADVERMGGHIVVDSTPGQGTTIELFIPKPELIRDIPKQAAGAAA